MTDIQKSKRICQGEGMTAGLELWKIPHGKGVKFVLVDSSTAGLFAEDVGLWNLAAGLNAAASKRLKDAAKQDTPKASSGDTHA